MESSFELKSEKMLFPGPSSASAGVKYWEIATTREHHLLTGGWSTIFVTISHKAAFPRFRCWDKMNQEQKSLDFC